MINNNKIIETSGNSNSLIINGQHELLKCWILCNLYWKIKQTTMSISVNSWGSLCSQILTKNNEASEPVERQICEMSIFLNNSSLAWGLKCSNWKMSDKWRKLKLWHLYKNRSFTLYKLSSNTKSEETNWYGDIRHNAVILSTLLNSHKCKNA